jgi:hypothetical protein
MAVLAALAWAVTAGGTQPYDTYEATVAEDGPVAQYRFDDTPESSWGSRRSSQTLFDGNLSNVAFYASALSSSQIMAHYDAARFPVNTTLPTVEGTTQDGQTLTVNDGTWAGAEPISFAYKWRRCDSAGEHCGDIAGATTRPCCGSRRCGTHAARKGQGDQRRGLDVEHVGSERRLCNR